MIEVYGEHSLTFKLSNNKDFNSLDVFHGIIQKLGKEASRKGFKNMFTSEEKFFLENFVREVSNEIKHNNG